ncbi:type II toxin-antitoxin system HicA family toxin [Spirosoma sp. HMF3257]|uniref:Type II toxin-antitoxin system HicA family toxin n=1 Tax=Spirosoma telluris TaxID=2183553 RepID=A0A327NSV5_9BACT|nr:type II toxin-antitoxin system HicA family toxin [Spirosoma telluris]RAI76894.1 type II toxin-antitoxin system HicA family toxin [Spirosoma telluris]
MGKFEKLLIKLLRGTADNNFSFEELRSLLLKLGFDERIKASHHIYSKDGIDEIINLQPKQGKAKAYQVKQVRNLIVSYKLDVEEDGSEP